MPDAVAACRVCLAVDVRLLTIAGSLKLVYEQITNNALHTGDGRPVAACYICHAQLNKCRKLMRTSALAENVLTAIVHRQSKITEKSIYEIDRETVGLCGSLRFSGAVYHETEAPAPLMIKTEPVPLEIKTEPDSDIANAEIGSEEPEDGPQAADVADICKTERDSDEDGPVSLAQLCDTEMDTTEQGEGKDVASAQTSGADKQEADGSTTNRKQRKSQSPTRTAQRSHQCSVCQRRFKHPSNLMIHYRTHTGEKPFQCDVCQHQFSHRANLLQHVRTHTGEKPFRCNVCDHRFTQKSHLLQHSRTHTGEKPFQCKLCDHRFTQKCRLLTHMRTHTGEKPFKCERCDHRFNEKSNLLRHLRTHTGEKPFQCDVTQII